MPLTPPIDFPHPVNPDHERARSHMLIWGRRHGFDGDPTTWRRFLGADSARMITYAYPEAHGADLELAVEMMCFFFSIDEVFDGPLRQDPANATRYTKGMLSVLDPARERLRSPVGEVPPLTAAFTGLWSRSREGMSHAWQVRAAAHWTEYFWGNLTEDLDRSHRPPTTVDAYLSARRNTIGYRPCQDMIERASRFEVPPQVWYLTAMRRLSDLATDLVTLCNDVFSLEKEQDREETVNSVLLLAKEERIGVDRALDRIVRLTQDLAEEFHATADLVMKSCEPLHLTGDELSSVRRWVTGNHTWVGAHCDWSCEISRYAAGVDPVDPDLDHMRSLMYGKDTDRETIR